LGRREQHLSDLSTYGSGEESESEEMRQFSRGGPWGPPFPYR